MKDSASVWNYSNTVPKVDLTNPDEMIRANGAAEAAQTDRLRSEVDDYAAIIRELKDLCDKNQELVQRLQFMNASTTDQIRTILEDNNARIAERLAAIQDIDTAAMEERIAAGVRAAVADQGGRTEGQLRDTEARLEDTVLRAQDAAEARQKKSDDLAHRDSVRVYRNIQASMVSELAAQTEKLQASLAQMQDQQTRLLEEARPDKTQSILSRVSFGLIIGILIIQLLEGVGLITILLNMVR